MSKQMADSWPIIEHRESLTDPVRDELATRGTPPQLNEIRRLFPPMTGDPAFDPALISKRVEALITVPEVNTGDAYLDQSVKTGLVFIDATFDGDHPKYGVKHYADERHDGFVPTIVAAIDALTAWGLCGRAATLFTYWLDTFVKQNGTVRYYGTAISEYGQLLHTATLLYERGGRAPWWNSGKGALTRMADYLLDLNAQAAAKSDLIPGIPEADISKADPNNLSDAAHSEANRYFHNNAWVVRGLTRWAALMEATGTSGAHAPSQIRAQAQNLERRTLAAIDQTWPSDPDAWWFSPQVEPCPPPENLTASTVASYTNYRYWPELLSSGLLPARLAHRIVNARLSTGGQFCGMTRFCERVDDWPLADYLYGLWQLGRKNDFLLSLFGHAAYNQAEGHLTAYEQITLPPMTEMAPYCLPCQLVVARAARLLVSN